MLSSSFIVPRELTNLLYSCGALSCGVVTDVLVDKQLATVVSNLTFLRITYSPDASPSLPERLVFKRPLANVNDAREHSTRELEFYSQLAPELPSPPMLPWYLTTPDDGLILEDVRETHTDGPRTPALSDAECLQALEALALVHAKWWEHAGLGVTIGLPHTTESLSSMVSAIAALLPGFCEAVGAGLSVSQRELLERVFSSRLRPWLRLTDARALTVINGDAHSWNFLFPRKETGPVYLIDWQLWHVDVGARDIAFLIALNWYDPQRRRAIEVELLRKYHENLVANGISDYSWDDLWLDYRFCVVRNLTIPLLYWSRGLPAETWQRRLERGLVAYEELQCDDLL